MRFDKLSIRANPASRNSQLVTRNHFQTATAPATATFFSFTRFYDPASENRLDLIKLQPLLKYSVIIAIGCFFDPILITNKIFNEQKTLKE